jgi:hypothetical protein
MSYPGCFLLPPLVDRSRRIQVRGFGERFVIEPASFDEVEGR